MIIYNQKPFNVPKLKGISEKNIEEHLKLYAGYVKNASTIMEKVSEYMKDSEKHAYVLGELMRRFSFEYNGIRNHEAYFAQFEKGANKLSDGPLLKALQEEWGSLETFLQTFKALALTRGIGWAMLWHDPRDNRLLISWVDEQHLGQLNGCQIILALDMWEHSFVADYQPSGKKNYVEDFFTNLNWNVVNSRYAGN